MEFINNIKWYHVVIVCLVCVLVFLVFTGNNCTPNMCKNALLKSEGFAQQEQEQKQETKPEMKPETQQIKDNTTAEIVLYYALWCGHSKAFLPEWEKFEDHARKNFPKLRVTKVRCEDGNEATCMQKGIQGYPTVVLYPKGESEKMFDSERKLESLIKFVQENAKN